MSLIDRVLSRMEEEDQIDFVVALRGVLRIPNDSYSNIYDQTRLVFASDEDKLKAFKLLNKWRGYGEKEL